jgi:hypothetical protein
VGVILIFFKDMSFGAKDNLTGHTLLGCRIINVKIEVIGLTHVIGENDFTLQIKDGDASAVKGHSRLVSSRGPLVKDRRGHNSVLG